MRGRSELDPRRPWARIPRLLPGPADAWAGGTPHAIRFRLGSRPARPHVLYLDTRESGDGTPPRLAVAVNDTTVARVETGSGTARADGHSRHRIKIPVSALADGTNVRLAITNESGASVVWERIRLVEGRPTPAWAHLGRRGRLPAEAAALLAASLGILLLASLAPTPAESRARRAQRAAGPAAALILLGAAYVLPRDAFLAPALPRWLWLLVPWVLLALHRRSLRPAPNPGPAAQALPTPSRLRPLLVNGALSLVALGFSLLVAEFALRVVFRNVSSATDTRTYFHRQIAAERPNSFGFLEREFSLRKPEKTYRIAVIGDSLTAGHGLPIADRFSNRLERFLNENRRHDTGYEVLNFGHVGSDTDDQVHRLRMLVLNIDPDFVLLQWYINDFENRVHSGRPSPRPLVPSPSLHLRLLRASALYSLANHQWAVLQEALGLIESHAAYHLRRFGDPDGPDSVYAIERIHAFIGECKQRNTPVGIVLFPLVDRKLIEGAYAYDFLHDRVLEACQEEQITCVDLRTTFAAYPDYKKLWITPLDPHPSSLANRIAAERLLEAFGRTWLEARRSQAPKA